MPDEAPIDRAAAPKPLPKPGILDIHAYVPGKAKAEGIAEPVKLSANENALGSSEKAQEAYEGAERSLHLYPDPRASIVRAAIAERYRLEPERLIFGCGSDEVFQLLNTAFLEPGDNMVQGQYGFAAFAIGAYAMQAQVRRAPEPDFRIDVDELLACVDDRTRLVFLANPGNPTGTWIPYSEVRRLHEALPPSVVLVLDGAYGEFALDPAFDDGLDLARTASNVVVTHTFSKLHGLAALRIGWGYAPLEIAQAVDRIRLPFNTSVPAQRAAVAALADEDFQSASLSLVETWRPWLHQQLGGLGLDVIGPSAANFVLVGFPKTPGRTAADADAFLSARGLLVRRVTNYGLPDHIRVTIGLEAHNRALADALAEFMAVEPPPLTAPDHAMTAAPARPVYEKMAVVGCGLIGASVILAARAAGAVGRVAVADASEAARARIAALGFADSVTDDPAEAVEGADLVVFAVPVLAMGEAARAAAPALKPGATVTDVGSVKAAVAEALAKELPPTCFIVPGHPIAGTEQSGPDAGFAELFQRRWVILTPQARTDAPYQAAVEQLTDFWTALGAQVELMDDKHHDLVLAVTSHLPHLIAYTIVGAAADLEGVTRGEVMKYSAGGFRDFTRIAASDPTMWRDVFLTNKDAVLEILGRFTEDLQAMSRAIRWGEGDKLFDHFSRTRDIRRGIIAAGQESAEPNFGRDHRPPDAPNPPDTKRK